MRLELATALLLAAAACKSDPKPGAIAKHLDQDAVFLGPSPGFAGGDGDRLFALAAADDLLIAAGMTRAPDGSGRGLVLRFDHRGALDPRFGTRGVLVASWADRFEAVTVDSRGRIVLAGTRDGDTVLSRLTGSGSLDPSFGQGGQVIGRGEGDAPFAAASWLADPDEHFFALAIDPEARIVAAGVAGTTGKGENHRTLVARFSPDGALDRSFAGTGFVIGAPGGGQWAPGRWDELKGLWVDHRGKITASGWTSNEGYTVERRLLVRYDASGALDPSLAGTGFVLSSTPSRAGGTKECSFALAADREGRLVTAGFSFTAGQEGQLAALISRFMPDGRPDPSFGTGGDRVEALGAFTGAPKEAFHSLAPGPEGSWIAAGYSGHDVDRPILARYLANGARDPSFRLEAGPAWSGPRTGFFSVISAGAGIWAAGTRNGRALIVRLRSDGCLDLPGLCRR